MSSTEKPWNAKIDSPLRSVSIDPFRRLPPELAGLVIELLDPAETETLRRVGRVWKVLSEKYNGLRAVKRHCPAPFRTLLAHGEHDTSGAANLCFRRWLNYECSIAAALAHKVVRCYEVTLWDIRNDTLITSDYTGRLMIQPLRSDLTTPCRSSRELNLEGVLRFRVNLARFWLRGVSGMENGDVLVQLETEEMGYLTRTTVAGEIVWFIENDWCAVAFGADIFHVLHVHDSRSGIYSLEMLDLADGSTKALSRGSSSITLRTDRTVGDFKLVLSTNEEFMAVKCKNQVFCFFRTSTQQLIPIEEPETLSYAACDTCWTIWDPQTSDLIEICWTQGRVSVVYRYKYDILSGSFLRRKELIFPHDSIAPRGGLDVGRNLIFEEHVHDGGKSYFVIKPLRNAEVGGDNLGGLSNGTTLDTRSQYRILSIPDPQLGARKAIEMDKRPYRPTRELESNFFGFYKGFLVFQHVATGRLMVADFRPPW